MFGFVKSFGIFGSKAKITVPQDPNLEDKLKQISTQILKTQSMDQFKVYQQLQSPQNFDFNRNLRKIYEFEGCTTETINCIIRFYTFLLTNCKNELVICKLVSQPLVIELTKIVLQINQTKQDQQLNMVTADCLESKQKQEDELSIEGEMQIGANKRQNVAQSFGSEDNGIQKVNSQVLSQKIQSLHYLNDIDWDQVNAYKIALIRSYINCINPETIKYMIINNELPIFVNCVIGYKHYLSEGVQGTCLSNCILMIMTKVNHNDEVCQIIFDPEHHTKSSSIKQDPMRQTLSKSISNEKSVKLHVFVKQVILKISAQVENVINFVKAQTSKIQENKIEKTLKQFRKLDENMEFIESNILFCVDLINSINNYNYTAKIKENIGEVIEKELIGKIVNFQETVDKQTKFQLTILKVIRLILTLSIACQKQMMIIMFLNKKSVNILDKLIEMNAIVFIDKERKSNENVDLQEENVEALKPEITSQYQKQCLTYLCNYAFILLKQTISPYSKLASRKRLQISHQIVELKQKILQKIFILLQQMTKSQKLRYGICLKSIRNIMLCVFYLTIKEDRCSTTMSSPQKSPSKSQAPNIGLMLQFKYSILLLHKIFSEQFKKVFAQNKYWQFIVNNYESLMRDVPNTILSAQENDKYCHYHNGNNYQDDDMIRDKILICEAVRNYRYMIIHETNLEDRLIRLENIYHKHFLSPGWSYHPGEIISFNSAQEYKIVCVGLLHNNTQNKLPIEILQDFECLIITHKMSQHNFKIIANIRYKKINSFVPEGKYLIRMKLIGIQELILQFSSTKVLVTFKEYLNENRNKTREKELKFINYYLNMYSKDSQRLIQQIYNQDLVLENGQQQIKDDNSLQKSPKRFSLDNIETENFQQLQKDSIPEQATSNFTNNKNTKSKDSDISQLHQQKGNPQQTKIGQLLIGQQVGKKQYNVSNAPSINQELI